MVENKEELFIVLSPAKIPYVCKGLEFANKIKTLFDSNTENKNCSVLPAQSHFMCFDEGVHDIKEQDIISLEVDSYNIIFYIQDYSSLRFALNQGLLVSKNTDTVFLSSSLRTLVLPKEVALNLKKHLRKNHKSFKKREDKWFQQFPSLTEIAEKKLSPSFSRICIN